ncbi:MAG: hypothetical protein IKQ94_12035 [Bacteroidales bacterium]|nr:hypothetical protein [Bacteroidales bacterium]
MRKVIFITTALLFCQAFFAQPVQERTEQDATVYICTGPSSKCYHKTDKCKGISRCSKEIIEVKQSYAESKGRTPCKMCYKK